MPEHISDSEMERIAEFATTPMYKRSPDQLLPDGAADDDE